MFTEYFGTVGEILDLILITVALGYVFSGFIKRPRTELDLLYRRSSLNLEDFKFAILIAAPAVILHELAHKFVAIAFGLSAKFYAWGFGLFLGAFLRFIGSPFILLAPGYVGIPPGATDLQTILIAFAGPFTNLVLWLVCDAILKRKRHLTRKQAITLYLTKQINIWLFIFNMLPIPPLDGSKVFYGLFRITASLF